MEGMLSKSGGSSPVRRTQSSQDLSFALILPVIRVLEGGRIFSRSSSSCLRSAAGNAAAASASHIDSFIIFGA